MYERLFVIEPPAGYAPLVGRLVSMLEFVRTTTFMSAKGLTTPQLRTGNNYYTFEDAVSGARDTVRYGAH